MTNFRAGMGRSLPGQYVVHCKTSRSGSELDAATARAWSGPAELRDGILRSAPTAELREIAQAQGIKTLRQAGLQTMS